jgi:hypothetical protein
MLPKHKFHYDREKDVYHLKTITRHVWEDEREQLRDNRLSAQGKELDPRRKETIERSFADAKELHGMRYARMRGLPRVREHAY